MGYLIGQHLQKSIEILVSEPTKSKRNFHRMAHAQSPKCTLNFFIFTLSQSSGALSLLMAEVANNFIPTVYFAELTIEVYCFKT